MRSRLAVALSSFGLAFILAPSPVAAQATPATICKDGSTSAVSGRGACSSHGGVDAKATDAAKKAAATVTCSDGATSKAGKGACSGHGGVKGSAANAATPVATASKTPASRQAPKTKTASKAGDNSDPTDATAQCKDGTYSHAKTHQGACSKHGGVAKFLK